MFYQTLNLDSIVAAPMGESSISLPAMGILVRLDFQIEPRDRKRVGYSFLRINETYDVCRWKGYVSYFQLGDEIQDKTHAEIKVTDSRGDIVQIVQWDRNNVLAGIGLQSVAVARYSIVNKSTEPFTVGIGMRVLQTIM